MDEDDIDPSDDPIYRAGVLMGRNQTLTDVMERLFSSDAMSAEKTVRALHAWTQQTMDEVRVEMQVSNRAVNLVEEGIDVALRVRPSVDDSGSMVVKRLDHTTQILVASPELLIRQGTPQTLDDLAKLDSIAMSAPDGRSTWNLIGPGGVHQQVQHTPRYVADDLLTLKYAAVAGTGVCWMPDYMCQEEMRERKLVRVLPDWAPAPAIVHAVFPSRRGLSPAVRRFLDYLGEAMPGRSSLSTRQALQGLDGANI